MQNSPGERLKILIKENKLTNKEFAAKVGIAPNYVSMIITGKKTLSDSLKFSITKVISDVNLNWLETGEGDMYISKEDDDSNQFFMEYQGVKIPLVALIDHFVKNKEIYLEHEYLKLWLEHEGEKLLSKRLEELGLKAKTTIEKKTP